MRSYIALASIVAILAALVSAAPSLGFKIFDWTRSEQSFSSSSSEEKCMTPQEAETTADIFRMLIQEYSHELATEALTEDFVDWASSVNIIINKGAAGPKSMDKPTFASRAAFIDGQGKQPQIPFTKIRVWPGCRHVAMRWKTGKSANGHLTEVDDIVSLAEQTNTLLRSLSLTLEFQPVHGHAIIDVVPAEEGNRFNWRIKNIFSEFNSGAWLVNLGVFKPAMMPNSDDVRHMREFGDEVKVEGNVKGEMEGNGNAGGVRHTKTFANGFLPQSPVDGTVLKGDL